MNIIERNIINGKRCSVCTHDYFYDTMDASTEKGVNQMVNLSEGMSTKDVAEILGVSERTVRNICNSKELVHYRVGTKLVVLPEDLKEYIKSLKIEKEME